MATDDRQNYRLCIGKQALNMIERYVNSMQMFFSVQNIPIKFSQIHTRVTRIETALPLSDI